MSNSALTTLVLLLAVVSVAALVVALVALRRAGARRAGSGPLPTDVAGLREEVGRLRDDAATSLRRPSVVRYDAFGDMGGRLSWSLALLDAGGDGIVLTSIHGRSDARTYAKSVTRWQADQPLSPEEDEAVQQARR
ncbi:MAG TPA: DUF4446 family protein, partial [Marmoricola sp.]|nr:DUF4446 family protein [Marmoricola sp.]